MSKNWSILWLKFFFLLENKLSAAKLKAVVWQPKAYFLTKFLTRERFNFYSLFQTIKLFS